ncbi:MAG: hypothetical protein HY075_13920 [Deltaproteobacteria bacterium]|nr:hypothetical protein [Deltaproteobacteria bacterium]
MAAHDSPPVQQAFTVLRVAFTVAPIVAGIDKFSQVLVNWDAYLAPQISGFLRVDPRTFMSIAGVIEIIAGLGVAVKPRIFGHVVALWLAGIIVNLLMTGQYYDIALRDLGLCLAAFALGRLGTIFDRRNA